MMNKTNCTVKNPFSLSLGRICKITLLARALGQSARNDRLSYIQLWAIKCKRKINKAISIYMRHVFIKISKISTKNDYHLSDLLFF